MCFNFFCLCRVECDLAPPPKHIQNKSFCSTRKIIKNNSKLGDEISALKDLLRIFELFISELCEDKAFNDNFKFKREIKRTKCLKISIADFKFIPISFLNGQSRPLFLYFCLFNSVHQHYWWKIKFVNDWIQNKDRWFLKQPPYHLSHNHGLPI